jgi:hypothetical protein
VLARSTGTCRHLSRRLEADLLAAGEQITRAPPKLMIIAIWCGIPPAQVALVLAIVLDRSYSDVAAQLSVHYALRGLRE